MTKSLLDKSKENSIFAQEQNKNNMPKIPFTVSARTAKLIGQENFANAEGAIVELVKNTYDADSKNCIVIFENNDEYADDPSIYIIDNGTGMTDEIICQHWMTIGTDDKLQNHQSDSGRIKTGAKGIGRFALNRLGITSEMVTVSRVTNKAYHWEVDWREFDKQGAVITDVEADLNEIPFTTIEEEMRKKFPSFTPILKILEENNFIYGTIIKISQLNDKWEKDTIKKLFDNLEILIPPQEQPSFNIHIFSTSHPKEFGQVNSAYYDDYDYKIKAYYWGDKERTLEINITRNELNIEQLEKNYKEIFLNSQMSEYPFRLEDFKKKTFTIKTSLNNLKGFSQHVDNSLIDKIGEFDFTFYFIKNTISDDRGESDIRRFPYKDFQSPIRKAWLKKFGGVKIFRDEFRVRPYGEYGEDWLKLGERQAQSPGGAGQKLGGYRIRPNQISGTINISRINNPYFQDKSGREGIQENDVFELFKNILIEIIAFFERDRNTIMYNLSELSKKRDKEALEVEKAKILAEKLNKERQYKEDQMKKTTPDNPLFPETNVYTPTPDETLAKGYINLELELEEKEREIRLLRNLASTGLIISSFAHEVKSLSSRLLPRTAFLLKELKKYISNEELKNIPIDDNPFYMIELIQQEDIKLKHWLDYSLSSLKKDKRKRTHIDINNYFNRFKATWEKAVEQRHIKINLDGNITESYEFRAFEVDLDSIFNNLLSNSFNSLIEKDLEEKEIKISWRLKDDFIEIIFYDNGKGLSEEYKNNPEEIFNSFESSKKDKKGNSIGTGLGLYIVKSIIEEYEDASIKIIETENCFSMKLTFKTR